MDELRQRLGQDGEQDDLKAARAGRAQRLDRAGIDVFHRFSVKPAQDAAVIDGERERAGKGPEPDGGDEENRPDHAPEEGNGRPERP